MTLVFFVYGLAFFSMGFAIALEARPFSGLKLARYLPYLAAFGILHSAVGWADMLLLIESATAPTLDMDAVRLVRTLLLGISTGALLQFGAGLLFKRPGRARWLLAIPGILGLVWVGALFLLGTLYPWGSRQWLIHSDVWARYLLYLPGSALAGFGLVSQARQLDRMDRPQIARDARFAAGTFLLNALVSGLVVPPDLRFPSSVLNSDLLQYLFAVPVQLLRALSALAIAYFILRVLRLFRLETARQVEEANRRQIEAQQKTLEIQKQAQAEMERWNREMAAENARLVAQVQKLATLEERERIAREMHDGLAQVLGFLGIKARMVQQLLSQNRASQAEKELEQMREIVQDAYAEVRQAILSLRTAGEMEMGLAHAIRESAADFAEQNSIPVDVALAEEGEVSFPPEAEVQLVRIVQEALANVRKHARATAVRIGLERRGDAAVLTVEDDGVGFDLADAARKGRHCFGLQTMRDRAESFGARLDVVSSPGEGTRVELRFPLEPDGREPDRPPESAAG